MNNKQKTNFKVLAASLFISSIIIGLNSPKTLTISSADSDIISDDTQPDSGTNTTTVSTNMLDVNSSIITTANVQKLEGTDQSIKITFADLPKIPEKIFAVLVDERTCGAFQLKFLDSNNSVEFTNVVDYVSVPGIHLYKQSPTDPDFTIRKENFIASSSYLMPHVEKIENKGLATAHNNKAQKYGSEVPRVKMDLTSDPQVYSLRIPKDWFPKINNGSDANAKNVLAVVLSFYENSFSRGTLKNEIKQWVATDYNEEDNTCRFDFSIPNGVEDFQVHLYKDGLYEDKFLCKFYIHLKNFRKF